MIKKESRNEMRVIRHKRLRKSVIGTNEIPRLCVYRSNKNISAQLIDDEKGITLASASSLKMKGNNTEVATKVGEEIAKEAKKLNKDTFSKADLLSKDSLYFIDYCTNEYK